MMRTIKKILIANRGEIAIRVMRTANSMGIGTVAVYSDADRNSLFVRKADEAIGIGGSHPAESYLNQDKIIAAAKQAGADAIHPGYGFLSENASFSKRCKDEGLIFIGPSAEAITAMGSKIGAKEIMKKAGVPVVPGYNGEDQSAERFKKEAEIIGYPVLLKASAGGGGKGMRIVNNAGELEGAVESAGREAQKSFGDGSLLMEKYFPSAKHIEFQIFGDEHGNYTHLFERECSLQRRYQKVIEESPSPSLIRDLRKLMGQAAVAAARSIRYTNAGTVEFILAPGNNFYFLEVNTRLQVEHPVTEETTGLDLVRMQIEVAQGLPLKVSSESVTQQGHSIQCRVCAEDPENNFFPATGEILFWYEPCLEGMRYDSGVTTGSKVDVFYDSLIAKVISKGKDRTEAIQRMVHALDKMCILGITSNKDFLEELLTHPAFIDGSFDTKLIEREFTGHKKQVSDAARFESAIAAMLYQWNRSKGQATYPDSLNGWRNIFYQPQYVAFEYGGKVERVDYRYLGNSMFDVYTGETKTGVSLLDAKGNLLSCTIGNHRKTFAVAGTKGDIFVQHPAAGVLSFKEIPRFTEPGSANMKGGYVAPMPGEIVKVLVKPGEVVKSGKGLLVMSSMKMETTIEAHSDGEVEEIFVAEKAFVEADTVLLKMKQQA
ncbi:MAG TPA: acetyl-CoA carboxylase biotin carboxylase subunit [Chitinophagales bacterium]|nr:acetyl-CoA carboxylase biotin carboxylase subunit [Chitinophagales bacterium]